VSKYGFLSSLPPALAGVILSAVIFGCATTDQQEARENHVALGNEYARDGLFREAIDQYRRALADNPQNHSARRNMGVISVKIGDYKNAIRLLEQSLPRFSNNFDTNFYLAEAYRAEGRYAQAIFYYQSSLRLKKDDLRSLKALAWSYYRIRYYSEALATATRSKELAPRDLQVSLILARTHLKLKQHRQALAEVRRMKAIAPKDQHAYLMSIEGDILAATGRCEHAMAIYRNTLRQEPTLAGALLGLAKCHIAQGRSEVGVEYAQRAVRIRPQLSEGYYVLGQALQSSDPARALQYYRLFLRHAATDPEYVGLTTEVRAQISRLSGGRSQQGRR